MYGFTLEWMVKERQRELLEEAARESLARLVGRNHPGPFAVAVRLLAALRLSRVRVHQALDETAGRQVTAAGTEVRQIQ